MLHGLIRIGVAKRFVKSLTTHSLIVEVMLGKENVQGLIEISNSLTVLAFVMQHQSHLITGDT